MKKKKRNEDLFELYDLKVFVSRCRDNFKMVCNHKIGDYFELSGENLTLPPGQSFPLYSLAALLPILPAKQRMTSPYDWISTDTEVACPDPFCGGVFTIEITRKQQFSHAEVTVVPLKKEGA